MSLGLYFNVSTFLSCQKWSNSWLSVYEILRGVAGRGGCCSDGTRPRSSTCLLCYDSLERVLTESGSDLTLIQTDLCHIQLIVMETDKTLAASNTWLFTLTWKKINTLPLSFNCPLCGQIVVWMQSHLWGKEHPPLAVALITLIRSPSVPTPPFNKDPYKMVCTVGRATARLAVMGLFIKWKSSIHKQLQVPLMHKMRRGDIVNWSA